MKWIMARSSSGFVFVGPTKNEISDNEIKFEGECYQVVWSSGSHRGWIGMCLRGPDSQARIAGGSLGGAFVRGIDWAIEVSVNAIEGIRSTPWS